MVTTSSNTLIATVLVPTTAVYWRDYEQGIKQAKMNIIVWQFIHSHPYNLTISSEVILHCRKCKFNWVEIRWIWRKKLIMHTLIINIRLICHKKYSRINHNSINSMISGCFWMQQLSIMIMELGAGNGCIWLSTHLTKHWNDSVQNKPSTISQWIMPSLYKIAGRTENLEMESETSE